MITITARSRLFDRRRGFTLVEMMIALTITSVVLTIVLGSYIFLFRTSVSMANYQNMNAQSRNALEYLGRDLRMTKDIQYLAADGLVVEIPEGEFGDNGISVIEYKTDGDSFVRVDDAGSERVLLEDVLNLKLTYFDLRGDQTEHPLEAKSVQLDAEMQQNVQHLKQTNHVISARFMMRNKQVSE